MRELYAVMAFEVQVDFAELRRRRRDALPRRRRAGLQADLRADR